MSVVRAKVRAQTGEGLKVKMRPEVSIKVAGCWASAQGRLESFIWMRRCDVRLVVMRLQALREEPLASTLRWPGDDKATCVWRNDGATRGSEQQPTGPAE